MNHPASGTIAQVVQHLEPGGIECLALDMLSDPPFGAPALLVSLEGTREAALGRWPRLESAGDRLIFMNKRQGLDPLLPLRLAALFRRARVRAVHTHHVGPLLYAGLAARLAGIRRLLHTEHDAWHLEDPARARLVRRLGTWLSPRIVADAEIVARRVRAHTGLSVDAVVRNGIDLSQFRPGNAARARDALGLPRDTSLIGLAGRLVPEKNQMLALRALATPGLRGVHLALAGDGPQAEALRRRSVHLGIRDRLHLLGRLDDMPTFFQAIDLFCLTSWKEGYPLVLLEAQACGVPVIASNVGGVPEAVCPGTGRLIAPDDADGLAAAIEQVLSIPRAANEGGPDPRTFALRVGARETMRRGYEKVLAA